MSEYLVEAGHFYSCNGPSNISLKLWSMGKGLAHRIGAKTALFIDNYHAEQNYIAPGEKFFDEDISQIIGGMMICSADYIFRESDIAKLAPAVAEKFKEEKIAKMKGDTLSASGIRLGTYVGGVMMPSCVMMDYVLLEEKSKIAPKNIILLPDIYEKEQKQLQQLVKLAAVEGLVSCEAKLVSSEFLTGGIEDEK